MRYMLDTNICVYLMKAHPPEVMARLLQLDHGDAAMSIITYAGLRVGRVVLGPTRAQNERALHLQTRDSPFCPSTRLQPSATACNAPPSVTAAAMRWIG